MDAKILHDKILIVDFGSSPKEWFAAGNVEKSVVERQGLNQRRELLEDVANLSANCARPVASYCPLARRRLW